MSEYRILTDHSSPDSILFNFDLYSHSISNLISNLENVPPYTIAINGSWGSGKTTLMENIKKDLENSEQNNDTIIRTIWFNAWKYSNTSSLISALSLEIYEEFVSPNSRKKTSAHPLDLIDCLIGRIQNVVNFWDPRPEKIVDDFINIALNHVSLIPGLSSFNSKDVCVSEWFNLPIYRNEATYHDRFKKFLKTIIKNYILRGSPDKSVRLVFFIDDLDRCNPRLISQLFEAINLFFDSDDCVFVIGLDLIRVVEYIEIEYKDFENFSGYDYLEKMIQLQFNLPCLHESSKIEYLNSLITNDSISREMVSQICSFIGDTPRKLKKFLNIIFFYEKLGESLLNADFEHEKFIKWLALRFVSEQFISRLSKSPELLLKIQDYANTDSKEKKEEIESNIYETNQNDIIFLKNTNLQQILKIGSKRYTHSDLPLYLHFNQFSFIESENDEYTNIVLAGVQSYTIGEVLKFSGVSNSKIQKLVYLFLTGPNLPEEGVNLELDHHPVKNNFVDSFTTAKVIHDETWDYHFETKNLEDLLIPGIYTLYCSTLPLTKSHLKKYSSSHISFSLKNPALTIQVNPSRTHCGKNIIITGINNQIDKQIGMWICGPDYLQYQNPSLNDQGRYTVELESFDTKDLKEGTYFVLSYPYEKGGPTDLILDDIEGKISINLQKELSDSEQSLWKIEQILKFIEKLDPEVIYVKAQFYLKKPWISISSGFCEGNNNLICCEGNTNLYDGDQIVVKINPHPLKNWDVHHDFISEEIFVSRGDISNIWKMCFDISKQKWKNESLEIIVFPKSFATHAMLIIERQ